MTAFNKSQTALSTSSQEPLVSVILPSYNRPGYLKEAIKSAVQQTYQNDDIPSEVGGYWDICINYLCCRTGKGAYYYPERLTRFRVHPQSYTESYVKKDIETNIRKANYGIFLYERLMEDERLEELKPYLKNKLAHVTTTLGINLLRAKKAAEARPYLLSALDQHPSLRTLVALILSFTPESLASRF